MGLWLRWFMALVGVATLFVYSVAAFATFLLLQWLIRNPPDPLLFLVSFALAVVIAGIIGHRLGSLRVIASLDATLLPRQQAPELHRRLDRLAAQMHVRRPQVLVSSLGAPNALSIGGPRKGVIVLDRQLFELLTIDELEGILAHELAHLESHHTFVNTLVFTSIRTVVGVILVIFLPFVLLLEGVDRSAAWFSGRPTMRFGLAALFKFSILISVGFVMSLLTVFFLSYSRKQEFAADSRAADVTGKPAALARALAKIHRAQTPRGGLLSLLYIDDSDEDDHPLLSTHPPVNERIDRLLERVDHGVRHHHVSLLRPI